MSRGEGPAAQENLVREQLAALTAWDGLRRSPQLSAFLRYVVEAELNGQGAGIKAYSIAVDVFGREADFDPQTDPIVRVQARRLRSLLVSYYRTEGADAPLRIVLPVGRYVPVFEMRDVDAVGPPVAEPAAAPAPRARWLQTRLGMAAALVAAIVLGAWLWPLLWQAATRPTAPDQPGMPLVVVREFDNLTSGYLNEPLVAGLAVELVTDFNQFPDVSALYGGQGVDLQARIAEHRGPVFTLTGVVRRVVEGIQYSLLLSGPERSGPATPLDLTVPFAGGEPVSSWEDIARRIVAPIASPRGPLQRPARDWLAGQSESVELELYPCLVAFHAYRELRQAQAGERIEACGERALQGADTAVFGHAILAALASDRAWDAAGDAERVEGYLAEARQHLGEALRSDQLSGFVWSLLGQVALVEGDRNRARDYYSAALQLNPAAVDTLAAFSTLQALRGNWPSALSHADLALELDPAPPARFHIVPALHALREGDFERAIAEGRAMKEATPDFGAALLVAAGGHAGRIDVVNSNLPIMLNDTRFRSMGIMPALRQHTSDPELLRQFTSGLLRAGVPIDRLGAPF